MIVPMHKYSFLIFHKEYHSFLEELQQLGVLHVMKKNIEVTGEIKEKYMQLNQLNKTIRFLQERENPEKIFLFETDGLTLMEEIEEKQNEQEALDQQLEELKKEHQKAKPWGTFSPKTIQKLKEENIVLRYFISSQKKFSELDAAGLPVILVREEGAKIYFIIVQKKNESWEVDADEVTIPGIPFNEIEKEIEKAEQKKAAIEKEFDEYAGSALELLKKIKTELENSLDYDHVVLCTITEAEEKLMILEGWIPKTKKAEIDAFLEKNDVLFVSLKATPKDNAPVLLTNNRFTKLFEPIGEMFSLPDYNELDLTVFFAPFFMLFFGFCLGDAGYGLLFIVGAGLYKFKAPKTFKPYLSLIQFLGLATIIFGTISGTFFGINLIETKIPWIENFKHYFLDPNKMFNLALVLGGVQIIFGLFIKAANRIKQFGFQFSLAIFGWLIVLLGSGAYVLLSKIQIISPNKIILYGILATGGFFILFFSDPEVNILARIGKGIWDVYSTVTGIFGDLLSYIRLFALGLSSAILGFVINDIAMQILGSSKILGPLFFVVFLLLGHTLNILISSLGSFVHPMRLTFVEFYKNAGFKGGGEEYKPFKSI
ncbi:MAG TPA: V-type ATPase 116kDa subunit family protein [Draconibacterium sp.]|nr:V-type ATPase 116kDa subunit family protein [Draconibacterium sp.]